MQLKSTVLCEKVNSRYGREISDRLKKLEIESKVHDDKSLFHMFNMPFPHGKTILFQCKVISYNTVYNLDTTKEILKRKVYQYTILTLPIIDIVRHSMKAIV